MAKGDEVSIGMVVAIDEPAVECLGMLPDLFGEDLVIETMDLLEFPQGAGFLELQFCHCASVSSVESHYCNTRPERDFRLYGRSFGLDGFGGCNGQSRLRFDGRVSLTPRCAFYLPCSA